MNKNKGIIGIGLLVAIVLGIAVVGGGAYYLGKGNNKPEVKTPESVLQNVENQNLPVVEKQKVTPTTTQVSTGCTSSSTTSIKVLSPNGGEVFNVGDKITVKWESCNIPNTANVSAGLLYETTKGFSMVNNGDSRIKSLNDGVEIITIPQGETKGLKYKIDVDSWITGQVSDVEDVSDNLFTINSSTPITWLKSPQFGLYYQNTLNIIEYYVDRYGKQVDKKDGMPMFYASWGEHQDSGITWGGNYEATNPTIGGGGSSCMDDNDFGIFEYGISSVTCLKGHVARVSRTSARNTITKEDLKMFGDFVLKNR